MSLKLKIFLGVMAIIIITVISVAVVFNIGFERYFSQYRLDESARELDEFLARAETIYEETGSRSQVQMMIRDFASENNIEYIPDRNHMEDHHMRNMRMPAERGHRMMEERGPAAMTEVIEEGLRVEIDGEEFGFFYWPEDDGQAAVLQEIDAQTERLRRNINRFLIPLAALLIFMAGLLIFGLVKRHTKPIEKLVAAVEKIEEGEYDVNVPLEKGVEFQSLAGAIDSLSDRLKYLERVRRQSVSDISHEMRTPLGNLKNYLEALSDGMMTWDKKTRQGLEEEVRRLIQLTERFEELTAAEKKAQNLEPEKIDLRVLFQKLRRRFVTKAGESRLKLNFELDLENSEIVQDREALRTVLENLISNAIKYSEPGGEIEVRAAGDDGKLKLKVRDTGIGIPPGEQELIFERFYRTYSSRSRETGGTGLGLAIVKELVEAMEGEIEVNSGEEGTEFLLILPAGREI